MSAAAHASKAKGLVQAPAQDEQEAEQAPLSWPLIKRIWAYTAPHRRWRNVLVGIVIMRAVQLTLIAGALGWVVEDLDRHRDPVRLAWGTAAFFTLALFTELTLKWRQLIALRLGEAVVHDLRRDIYGKLQTLTMGFFNRTKLGRIISRITSDAEAVRAGVQDVLFVSLVNGGQMIGAAILMAIIDWRLFLVVLGISPAMWALNKLFSARMSRAFRLQQESYSRITATIAESVNGIRVTQGFGREEENARLFGDLVAHHGQNNLVVGRLRGFFMPLLDLNNQLFLACLLFLGGWLVLNGKMPVDDIVQFFFLAGVFFSPISNLGNQYTAALTAMAGAERVFSLLDRQPDWTDAPGLKDPGSLKGEVEFRDVHFSYIPGKPVLHGISFHARPGQCIALVGPTGSGKSSVINLIARFYPHHAGRLCIDGIPIRELDPDAFHRQLGIVLQVNFLFTGTILDNIRLAKPEMDEARVRGIAESLGCLDLLEALPQGLMTQVGEGGASLSLGQRQLVCFCRAMLADPRILILDEATSAVDTITEARVQQALERLLKGRTSFVVAHRLSTIRHADQVLMLKDGRIVERGTHRELLAAGGEYAAAYRRFLKGAEG